MVAFALSSLLTGRYRIELSADERIVVAHDLGTGLSFLLLGALRLGSLIGFFPRHILVGYE